jgi:hypothetical protein
MLIPSAAALTPSLSSHRHSISFRAPLCTSVEKAVLMILRQKIGAGELLVEESESIHLLFLPMLGWAVADFVLPSSSSSEPASLLALRLDLRRAPATTIVRVPFLREFDTGVPTMRATLVTGS